MNEEKRRCGCISIAYEYLNEVLKLPPGAKVVGVDNAWRGIAYSFQVYIEYAALPEIEEGMPPTELRLEHWGGEEYGRLEALE